MLLQIIIQFIICTGIMPPSPEPSTPGPEVLYQPLQDGSRLQDYTGRRIAIQGKISRIPWQHMIDQPRDYPEINYLTCTSGIEVVLYSKSPIQCEGPVKVIGVVIKVEGSSKRPGSIDSGTEYQLMVENWECQ